MPVEIGFQGWFQVRLATDPDPHDDPVGISGYTWSLPGEPDFDRLIRFQPRDATVRPECAPEIGIGVRVHRVSIDGTPQPDHPLLASEVDLQADARYEGRNGIVATNGLEPIVPFDLSFATRDGTFGRGHAETYEFPYTPLRAGGIDFTPAARAEVAAATGIDDLGAVWERRRERLRELQRTTADADVAAACGYRIAFLTEHADLAGDYGIIVRYAFPLATTVRNPAVMPAGLRADAPWSAQFWMGGWDFDALCGFVSGSVTIIDA